MQPDIRNLQTWATGLLAGLLFTAGLAWSDMTDPAKVIGFLNVAVLFTDQVPGAWDASLAYAFQHPTRTDIDARLLTGTACCGLGWGLGGFCPAPALSAVLVNTDLPWFLPAMGLGMWVATKQHAGA